MVHITSLVCMQDEDTLGYSPYLDNVQTNMRHGNSTKQGMSNFTVYGHKQPSTPATMNLVCHGMSVIHWVRPMCTGVKDTPWILAVSWSPQSLMSLHEALSYA